MSPLPQPWYPEIQRDGRGALTEAQLAAICRGEPVTIEYPVPDARREPIPEAPVRLAILDVQRVAPRGAGLPRRSAAAGVAMTLLIVAGTVLYGLAIYGALALWRALP